MNILENFSLSRPYKFCIYLASIILVSSFITQPFDVDVNSLRKACFSLIAWGIVFWIVENIYYDHLEALDADESVYIYEELQILYNHKFINAFLNGLYLFIGLVIVGNHF
ncbi:MAG: hypothetical protein PWR29_1463 [Methanolobus sp.]|jgi:hypothetical protein|nr:hypothetical protein [Methanolobus sp.]